ncbi:two component regulator with propeller domain [Tenacibaculum adriaticum]|uniref:Two component regulator with propeller domain n=1 Tax=Tenacibaculum adriaticum TaxID=413713 RepID=A0A5S5DTN9_9FLAO|nr:triple tyrosine motif-containing protein [Tenacibaculum adriaticum]TYP99310.1 two component regulator with propeller domain [Tenacibaculum adriaticum]
MLNLSAQELPPVNTFSPEDYRGESQNWSISQSKEGFIYVANNKGLLEFNGADWKLYPTPNETIMRSVKVVENKIFTGFYMDFGYWIKDQYGVLQYSSIAKRNKISPLEDEQFWSIIEMDGWVLFQSFQRIYLYNLKTEAFKVINSETTITKMFKVDNTIYFQQVNKGIYKIEKGEAKLISGSEILKENSIVFMSKNEGSLIFLTDSKGFYKFENNNLSPWNITSNQNLNKRTIYNGIQLSNGDFVLGTISHGAIYLLKNGEIKYELNQKNGLNNNTVLSLFEDKDSNVWLGLDSGISVVNIKSPFKIYKDISGNIGTVYTSIIFNNNLYIGTNQGLFYKKYKSKEDFILIKGTEGQVWCLVEIDGNLFCGHNTGTFLIDSNNVNKISNSQGTWGIKKLDTTTLIQGNYNGLHILKKKDNRWLYSHKIKGFDNSSRYFEVYENNTVFVNHEYKGVFKLKVDKDFKEVLEIKKVTSVNKGIHSSLLKYHNQIIYSYKKGVYKFSSKQDLFVKDTILSKLFSPEDYMSGKLVFDPSTDKIWGFSTDNISYIVPDELSSNLKLNEIHVSERLRKGAIGFENIEKLDNQNYLLGTSNGYIIIDLDKLQNKTEFVIEVNSIKNSTLHGDEKELTFNDKGKLSFKKNNIEFFYNVPYYGNDLTVNYQYKLKGQTDQWSNWTANANVLFKNLSFGDYTFNVRARVGNNLTSNTYKYKFTVLRPWYLSTGMIIGYVFMILLFSLFMHNTYKRYYKKQRERLLEKQQKDFEFKALANERELMRVKNDQLKADVENKNRELAISTMSIIKKNEFLNTIKGELKSGESTGAKKVIKIINENINNTDDWQMFKEAFNNADKDFIKKIKDIHPALTPNDLRLCAYLRLNLSSKEIAPLLNISPRSVEVKRYRLRKKMDLPHESNLTEYILKV